MKFKDLSILKQSLFACAIGLIFGQLFLWTAVEESTQTKLILSGCAIVVTLPIIIIVIWTERSYHARK